MEKEKVGVLSPGASHEVSLVLTTSTLLPNLAQDSISTSLGGKGGWACTYHLVSKHCIMSLVQFVFRFIRNVKSLEKELFLRNM